MRCFFDLLSSRLVIAVTLFVVLFIGGIYLIGQYRYATDAVESITREKNVTAKSGRKSTTSPLVRPSRPNYEASSEAEASLDDSKKATEVKPLPDLPIAEEKSFDTEANLASPTNERVSPFGFGPYPDIPDDYSLPRVQWQWSEEKLANVKKRLTAEGEDYMEYLKTYELIGRVAIKLWNEGHRITGITTSDQTGLFYPGYPDVVYVKWVEYTDSEGNAVRRPIRVIGAAGFQTIGERRRGEFPEWIEVRDMENGIDPYEFLGLNR